MIRIKGLDTYFGGKGSSGTFQRIINHIRPHDILIIPFLGNCAVTRHIKRAAVTAIGIDASGEVVDKWKAMKFDWIQIRQGCGIEFLENFVPERTTKYVVYCDPPYPMDSRKSQDPVYDFELSGEQHLRLISSLLRLDSMHRNIDILISTYQNEVYEAAFKKWQLDTFSSTTRRGSATEYLYMDYKNPEGILHDYSYIGVDYRERERIKKKINRWVKRLEELPGYEKNAIIRGIEEKRLLRSSITKNEVASAMANTDGNDGVTRSSLNTRYKGLAQIKETGCRGLASIKDIYIMKTDLFQNLTDQEQLIVCAAHQEGFKKGGISKPIDTFKRLFELGNPKIVLDHAKGQVRIHEESANVMKVILKNYL